MLVNTDPGIIVSLQMEAACRKIKILEKSGKK